MCRRLPGVTRMIWHDQNGMVKGWGGNDSGQSTTPSGLSNVVAIAAGYQHSLALVSNAVSTALTMVCPTNLVLAADPGQCSRSNVTFVVAANGGSGSIGIASMPPSGSTFAIGTDHPSPTWRLMVRETATLAPSP